MKRSRVIRPRWLLILLATTLLWSFPALAALGGTAPPKLPATRMAPAGEKIWLNESLYFTHEFDKTPAMGPLVLKIKLFNKDGTRSTALKIKGSSDMPSMRGAHDTGFRDFRISKRGDYLLPVDIVMPGDWEIQVIIYSGETAIYHGLLLFDI